MILEQHDLEQHDFREHEQKPERDGYELKPQMKEKIKNEMILTWTRLEPLMKDKNKKEMIRT